MSVQFSEILAKRKAELEIWTQAVVLDIRGGLATKVGEKIVKLVVETIGKLQEAQYVMPTEENPLVFSFNFHLDRGELCTELTESLPAGSIIKGWIELAKKDREETEQKVIASASLRDRIAARLSPQPKKFLHLNYPDWNGQLDKVATKVQEHVTEALLSKVKGNGLLYNFNATYTATEEESSGSKNSYAYITKRFKRIGLEVSFWAASDTQPKAEQPAKSGGGFLSSFLG